MAKVLGTLPVVPERVRGVRRTTGARRLSSGRILRAELTFGPAMWACMSTPPGMTTRPVASITRSGHISAPPGSFAGGPAIILPSWIQRS